MEVAELLAAHFNRISSEFDPLEVHQIPTTHWKNLPILLPHEVAGRIRAFKQPKSMVKGDGYLSQPDDGFRGFPGRPLVLHLQLHYEDKNLAAYMEARIRDHNP